MKIQIGYTASHPASILCALKGSCRLSGWNFSTHQVVGIIAENNAAFPGKTGIDQKLEQAATDLQGQELDLDDFGIVEAAIMYIRPGWASPCLSHRRCIAGQPRASERSECRPGYRVD